MDLKDLTGAGWILLVATVVGALTLGILVLIFLDENLPEGRYPRVLFLIPTFAIGLGIWWGGSKMISSTGRSITKKGDDRRPPTADL